MRLNRIAGMILASVLCFALSGVARAETQKVDFDQGIDISAIFKTVEVAARRDRTVVRPEVSTSRRNERDCVNFTFRPDDPLKSEAVWLRSTEWVEDCTYDPRGGRRCHERPGFTYRERVQITLQSRGEMFPWEYDSFDVCLDGPYLDIYERVTSHDFSIVRGGRRNGDITLAPGAKTPMRPDPNGIYSKNLTNSLTLTLGDRWASYYQGANVELKLTLKRYHKNWFDGTVITKEITLPTAESYEINFLDFVAASKLKAGKKYYVKIEFKRTNTSISTDKRVKSGETGKVHYQLAAAATAK